MSPELVSQLQTRIAELEPRERAAWTEFKRLEDLHKPTIDGARDHWVPLHTELRGLRELLAKECAGKCAEKEVQ